MFLGKVRSLVLSSKHCFFVVPVDKQPSLFNLLVSDEKSFVLLAFHTSVGYRLSCKHYTKQESLDKYKHSSLLQTFLNYGVKSFTTMALS
jgi:hypothetical protein